MAALAISSTYPFEESSRRLKSQSTLSLMTLSSSRTEWYVRTSLQRGKRKSRDKSIDRNKRFFIRLNIIEKDNSAYPSLDKILMVWSTSVSVNHDFPFTKRILMPPDIGEEKGMCYGRHNPGHRVDDVE